jgi:hypothetical protein
MPIVCVPAVKLNQRYEFDESFTATGVIGVPSMSTTQVVLFWSESIGIGIVGKS